MNDLKYYICPNCFSNNLLLNSLHIQCGGCNKIYNTYSEIVDFRDPENDSTASFSIANDILIAKILLKNFDNFENFNGLYSFYSYLQTVESLSSYNLLDYIKLAKLDDSPLSKEQCIHGFDIVRKAAMYFDEIGFSRFIKRDGLCLENGGGLGFFSIGLSEHFSKLIVLDFSLSHLVLTKKICVEKKLTNVDLICANVERSPLSCSSVDFIHSNNVIEHISNQSLMISEIDRILSKNGLLFLLSPNINSVYFEPHFRFPLFGFIPFKIRHWLIWKIQDRDCRSVSLLSLSELKILFSEKFKNEFHVTFIPRHLRNTAQGGILRKVVISMLSSKVFGRLISFVLNKFLLNYMPYHVILGRKK
jgi:ubiquinone/menaquinone biosynthesis C-methylase UbiE